MNNVEFSNLFDVLWNNINSNLAPGLNEYEKSVLLTKALDEVLKNYFNPKSNTKQEGYDDSIKRLADFSGLMREENGILDNSHTSQFDPRSLVYKVPEDVYLLINEQILLKNSDTTKGIRQILPINYDEYRRVMSKPYKEPLKYQAWRLFTSTESNSFNGKRIAEIILTSPDKNSNYTKEYKIRYIKFPKPIILSDFSEAFGENISINGYNGSEENYSDSAAAEIWENYEDLDAAGKAAYDAAHDGPPREAETKSIWDPCELDPVIHEEILQRAIELAKIAWSGDVNTAIQTGLRSE